MGSQAIIAGAFGKALQIGGGNVNITPASAWLFENQSGTLGTNLTGSQIYVGGAGTIVAILSGVTGAVGTVIDLNLSTTFPANPSYPGFSGGTGYTTATNLATTVTSLVYKSPAQQPTGLTVNITAVAGVVTAITIGNAAGTNYSVGDICTVQQAASGLNCTFAIGSVKTLLPNFTDHGVTFTDIPVGTILPIAIDYVSNASGASLMVALK
jgi:hypothetical protein